MTTTTPPAARAVHHQIDGGTFFVSPDGTLGIYEVETPTGKPISTELCRRDAYALFLFMQLPAVAALFEAVDAQTQTADQLDYEAAQREEEIKIATGYYDKNKREAGDA